MIFLIPCLVE
ncbi:hypothetical protein D018_2961A, partial [Vibrio parahaemolyticus VP2007-007]